MNISKFILLSLVLCVACNSKSNEGKTFASLKDSTPDFQHRIINHIDTSIYTPVSNGFYKNSEGDIFEQKKSNGEDSLGWYTLIVLESTLVVNGEYSNRKPLKDFIDLSSYTQDTISDYSKDKTHVYYVRAQSDGHVRFLVERANPKTFVGIRERWGKDDRYVFYNGEVVKNADVKSFHVLADPDSAKDKRHFYYLGEKVN